MKRIKGMGCLGKEPLGNFISLLEVNLILTRCYFSWNRKKGRYVLKKKMEKGVRANQYNIGLRARPFPF